jgi:chromosome segregation ATPase
MWFCQDCIGPASKLVSNISTIQQRQDELEKELIKSNLKQNSLEDDVKENTRALDDMQKSMSSMTDQLKEIQAEVTAY